MAFTLEAEQRLKNVSLIEFFEKKTEKWELFAKKTYAFVGDNFPKGANVRQDDIAKALIPLLEVDTELGDCLNEKKLRQKYWIKDFADLIIDRKWDVIKGRKGGKK